MCIPSPEVLDQQGMDYALLLAKHGYSAAGYSAVIQEVVDGLLSYPPTARRPLPSREALANEVENQLFCVVVTRIASPVLVLEQLQAFFALSRSLQTPDVTLYLLQRLGPLQQRGFYQPQPSSAG